MSRQLRLPAIILATVFFVFSDPATAQEHHNDIFSVLTIERQNEIQGVVDDHYYWLEYVYSNVSQEADDSFLGKVRSVFVDNDKKIVFQIQQEILAGDKPLVKASKILSVFDRNEELIGSDIRYRDTIISGRRFQNSDRIRIRASLSEVTTERAATLKLVIDELNAVPLVTSFTQGYLTVASTIIDAITGVTAGPSEKRKIGTYTIHGVGELAKTEFVAIVAKGDESKYRALISNPGSIPKTPNELNAADRSRLPSMVLMRVQFKKSLYSPTQILSANSPVRPLIENEIKAIAQGQNNYEKAKECVQLRSALRYLGPLTSTDEGYAAMAALKDAGYDPERTVQHENVGCLTYQEIEDARAAGFEWGNCNFVSCRVAKQYINNWVFGRDSGVSADVINWEAVLGGDVIDGSGNESQLRQALKLRRRYGDIEHHKTYRNAVSYNVIGVMFGKKENVNCVYDVEVSVGLRKFADVWRVDSVIVSETGRVFKEDGLPPSSNYNNLPKCSEP